MPSANFIAAASAANRKPVAFLAIESSSAIKAALSTKEDWNASSLKTSVNIDTEPGRIFMATDAMDPYSGEYPSPVYSYYMAFDSPRAAWAAPVGGVVYPNITTDPVLNAGANVTGITLVCDVLCEMSDSSHTTRLRGNPIVELYGQKDGGAWTLLQTQKVDGSRAVFGKAYGGMWTAVPFTVTVAVGTWNFRFSMPRVEDVYSTGEVVAVGQWHGWVLDIKSYQRTRTVSYLTSTTTYGANGLVYTKSLDLGIIPTDNSRLEVDDLIPTGCSISYKAEGSNNNSTWVDLGDVSDGSSMAPYRYYRFKVIINTNGINTPYLDEIRVIGGNSQYEYFSTQKDTPVRGAKPYIAPGGVSSISSKIDLSHPATVGELTIKLIWTKQVGDMIATGYLKNKTIICKIGFEGLAEVDYEPYFVGTWYDYQADHEKGIITVKTRNILKKFNRKVPEAQYFLDATGKAYVPPKTYRLSGNIMLVMLALADLLGIPDRYIDRASFTNLAAGARSGSSWWVSRYLTEPMDARDLLNELSVSSGVFIVEGADGKQTAILCDDIDSSVAVATLDAKFHKFKQIDGGQKELFTRQTIYYQLISGKDGSSASDYGKGLVYVNAQAEIDWQESATKEWMDKWGLSPLAIQKLAQRWDAWFSTPLSDVKVENVPPRFWGIKTGQVVAVDNLQFPSPAAEWKGFTSGTRFLVMSKTTSDPTSENLSISFDLKQLGTPSFIPDPDFPDYTPFDYYPLVRNLVLSERLVRLAGGSVETMLDVDFDRPIDFHYGSAAIWSRPVAGVWKYQGLTDLGGPEDARVFSFPVTDAEVVEVAVLTINAVGQTMSIDDAPKATRFIIGKTAPPANVTVFHVTPVITGGLRFSWGSVADLDVSEYVIRYSPLLTGASWDGASEVIRSSALYANLNIAQAGTYLIKAVDTTGHYSPVAVSVVVTNILAQVAMANHVTITEQPAWAGFQSNFVPNGSELWVAWTLGPPDPELPPMKYINASYEVSTEVDMGSPQTVRVSAKCDWISAPGSFDLLESIDNMASWDGATGKSTVQVYILTSQDASAPANPQPLFAGDYTFQKAAFIVQAYEQIPDQVKLKTLTISIDLHDTVITL